MSTSEMKVECRSCGVHVPAENLNIDKLVAKCGACNAVFGFDVAGGSAHRRQRANIAMPRGVTVENQGGDLVIVRSWRSVFLVVFLTVFTVIWNGITWTFFIGTLASGLWPLTAFLSIFLVVGALVGYATLCVLLNSTEIRVSNRRLTVKHGPLPVPGGVDVDPSEIEQLWVEQSISHSRSDNGTSSTSVSYPLYMRLKNGSKKALLRSVGDSELSIYLEQQVEEFLGIQDRAVRGEY